MTSPNGDIPVEAGLGNVDNSGSMESPPISRHDAESALGSTPPFDIMKLPLEIRQLVYRKPLYVCMYPKSLMLTWNG